MTKSRRPLHLLAPLLFCWPEAAPAQPASTATPEELLAAYNGRIHDAMGSVDGTRRCPRDASGDDAIVVCGRNDASRMRLPLPVQPEPGAHRLIAGELPTGPAAMAADRCLRLCYQPVTISIIPAIRALGSGVERILHPD